MSHSGRYGTSRGHGAAGEGAIDFACRGAHGDGHWEGGLELRHRWVFYEEFAALMISDDHGCRSEILVPVHLVQDLRDELRWLE